MLKKANATSLIIPRPMSRVAVLRGGGRHAAVVWEQIATVYDDVRVSQLSVPMPRLAKSIVLWKEVEAESSAP